MTLNCSQILLLFNGEVFPFGFSGVSTRESDFPSDPTYSQPGLYK